MRFTYNVRQFEKDMENLMQYSVGFVEGVQNGRQAFLSSLGSNILEILKQYVDANARVSPESLGHVYEWYQAGSPKARLFDLNYSVTSGGISFDSTFRQSTSIKRGSRVPFYDKASIMEYGIPVVIKPSRSSVLAFTDGSEEVFTRKPVLVENPGGDAEGQYEKAINAFFSSYFTQSYLQSSGMVKYLQNPDAYRKNLSSGKRGGKSVGLNAGYRWIVKAGGDI